MSRAIQKIERAAIVPPLEFDPFALRLEAFDHVPADHHGIATLRGEVVIYDTLAIRHEGIVEGAYYVRESQHPAANMDWENWLRMEASDPDVRLRAQPRSHLVTRREVVQAICWPYPGQWSLRLSGCNVVDGPFHDWAFGFDFVGKVVGLFRPGKEAVQ